MIDWRNQTNAGSLSLNKALGKVKGETKGDCMPRVDGFIEDNYTSPPNLFAMPAHRPFPYIPLGWPVCEMQGKGWHGTEAQRVWW